MPKGWGHKWVTLTQAERDRIADDEQVSDRLRRKAIYAKPYRREPQCVRMYTDSLERHYLKVVVFGADYQWRYQ